MSHSNPHTDTDTSANSRLDLPSSLFSAFDCTDHDKVVKLVDGIRKKATITTAGANEDPNDRLRGLSLRYTIHLQPQLSEAISSTHSVIKRKVREHENLAFKDRQRWMRQKEEREIKRQLDQTTSNVTSQLHLQPPWEPLVGERNLDEILSVLLHLQQAPDVSTQAHATLLNSGSTSRPYSTSHLDQERADRALWNSIFAEDPLVGGDAWEPTKIENDGLDSDAEGWTSSDDGGDQDEDFHPSLRKRSEIDEHLNEKRADEEKKDRILHFKRLRRREERKRELSEQVGRDRDRSEELKNRLEGLGKNQYWKSNSPKEKRSLSEVEAVGECLFALQGLESILFERKEETTQVKVSSSAESIKPYHLSESTFQSLLKEISSYSNTLDNLRRFISFSRSPINHHEVGGPDPILRSLGDSIASLLSEFGQVLVRNREDLASLSNPNNLGNIVGSNNRVITLMSLVAEIEKNIQALRALEEVLVDSGALTIQGQEEKESGINIPGRGSPSSLVLDSLQGAISFYWSLYDSSTSNVGFDQDDEELSLEGQSRSDILQTAEDLSRCFLDAAEPVWEEVKQWVGEGMEIRFDEQDEEEDLEKEEEENDKIGKEEEEEFEILTRSKKQFLQPCFARRNLAIQPQDGRFWKEGWSVISSTERNSTLVEPSFISPLARNVLDTGKCVGLLRALGWEAEILGGDQKKMSSGTSLEDILNPTIINSSTRSINKDSTSVFDPSSTPSNQQFLRGLLIGSRISTPEESFLESTQDNEAVLDLTLKLNASNQNDIPSSSPPSLSSSSSSTSSPPPSPSLNVENCQQPLSQILSTSTFVSKLSSYLEPRLALVQKKLHDVLTSGWEDQGCDLPAHLEAFLGLFLWRRGREMSQWINGVFEQVDDGRNSIFDSQHLNATLREEVVSSALHGGGVWIDTSLVRYCVAKKMKTRRGVNDWFVGSGVRNLSALRVDYLVPFPLTYFFTPMIQLHYQALFTFQLQFTRAQHLLARMSPSRPGKIHRDSEFSYNSKGAMSFVQIRKRLLWIVRVLSDFVSRDVIETHSQSMLSKLSNLVSYDSLIDLHSNCIKRIAFLSFLREIPPSRRQNQQGASSSFETETDTEAVNGLRNGTDVHELILDILDCSDEVAAAYRQRTGSGSKEGRKDSQETRQRASRRRRRRIRRRREKEARNHQIDKRSQLEEQEEDDDEGDDSEEEEESDRDGETSTSATQLHRRPNLNNLSIPDSSNPTNISFSFSASASGMEESFSSKMKRLNSELEKDVVRLKSAIQAKIGYAGSRGEVEARAHWQGLAYSLEEWN